MVKAQGQELRCQAPANAPGTCNCKVNSERDLRQHFPQRVVFTNPRYAESGFTNPELLAALGAMHLGLHA